MNGNVGAGASGSSAREGHARHVIEPSQRFNKISRADQDTNMASIGDPLYLWMNGKTQDGPWAPLGMQGPSNYAAQPQYSTLTPRMVSGLNASFTQFRTAKALSDTSTIPPSLLTDSGYASGPRPSVGNPSIPGDLDCVTDTQSLVGQMDNVEFFSGNDISFQADQAHSRGNWAQPPRPLLSNNHQVEAELVCSICSAICKTPSDMKKHEARHSRPHRCSVPGCTRTDGFSTANDLARHTRSLHPSAGPAGPFYKCHIDACAKNQKLWPRADNFRHHLKRKHKYQLVDNNIDLFIYNPTDGTTEPGENDHLGLHITAGGPDPAAIQLLTSQALGPDYNIQGRKSQVADPLRVNPDGRPPEDVSRMVDHRLPEIQTIDGRDQGDLHNTMEDQQSIHPQPDGLPSNRYIAPPIFAPSCDVMESGPPGQASQGSIQSQPMTPDKTVQFDVRGVGSFSGAMDPTREASPPALDLDDDGQSESDSLDGQGDLDAPGEVEPPQPLANTGPESHPEHGGQQSTVAEPDVPGPMLDADRTPEPKISIAQHEGDDVNDEAGIAALRRQLMSLTEAGETEKLQKLLEEIGYEKSKLPSKPRKAPANQGSAGLSPHVRCKERGCGSVFNRECELRKHMKRHQRPYGCTYKFCPRKFGSKSDWKRHENSQHHRMDVWKCNEKAKDPIGDDDQLCNKVCHRRETFKAHLQKDHGIGSSQPRDDSALIFEKLETCRYGKDCEAGFWCGFCLRVVETTRKEKAGGWTERYDHIDAHICGREGPKRSMDDWKHDDHDISAHSDAAGSSAPGLSQSSASGSTNGSTRSSPDSASPPGINTPAEKRRPGADEGDQSRRHKRLRVNKSLKSGVWFCCNCQYFNNLVLTDLCMNGGDGCAHTRCEGCGVREAAVE